MNLSPNSSPLEVNLASSPQPAYTPSRTNKIHTIRRALSKQSGLKKHTPQHGSLRLPPVSPQHESEANQHAPKQPPKRSKSIPPDFKEQQAAISRGGSTHPLIKTWEARQIQEEINRKSYLSSDTIEKIRYLSEISVASASVLVHEVAPPVPIAPVDERSLDDVTLKKALGDAFQAAPESYLGALAHQQEKGVIPKTRIPAEYFVYAASPIRQSFGMNENVTKDTEKNLWKKQVFPSDIPSKRIEVYLLAKAMDSMMAQWKEDFDALKDKNTQRDDNEELQHFSRAFEIHHAAIHEVARQAFIQCEERASLLIRINEHCHDLFRAAVTTVELERNKVRECQQVISRWENALQTILSDKEKTRAKMQQLLRENATLYKEREELRAKMTTIARSEVTSKFDLNENQRKEMISNLEAVHTNLTSMTMRGQDLDRLINGEPEPIVSPNVQQTELNPTVVSDNQTTVSDGNAKTANESESENTAQLEQRLNDEITKCKTELLNRDRMSVIFASLWQRVNHLVDVCETLYTELDKDFEKECKEEYTALLGTLRASVQKYQLEAMPGDCNSVNDEARCSSESEELSDRSVNSSVDIKRHRTSGPPLSPSAGSEKSSPTSSQHIEERPSSLTSPQHSSRTDLGSQGNISQSLFPEPIADRLVYPYTPQSDRVDFLTPTVDSVKFTVERITTRLLEALEVHRRHKQASLVQHQRSSVTSVAEKTSDTLDTEPQQQPIRNEDPTATSSTPNLRIGQVEDLHTAKQSNEETARSYYESVTSGTQEVNTYPLEATTSNITSIPIDDITGEFADGKQCPDSDEFRVPPLGAETNDNDSLASSQRSSPRYVNNSFTHTLTANTSQEAPPVQEENGYPQRRIRTAEAVTSSSESPIPVWELSKRAQTSHGTKQHPKNTLRRLAFAVKNQRLNALLANAPTAKPKKQLTWLLRHISNIYKGKFNADINDEKAGRKRDSLPSYVFDHFKHIYGTQSLVDDNMTEMMACIVHYRKEDRRIEIFGKLLSEEWDSFVLDAILKVCNWLEIINVGPQFEQNSGDEKPVPSSISLVRALYVVELLKRDISETIKRNSNGTLNVAMLDELFEFVTYNIATGSSFATNEEFVLAMTTAGHKKSSNGSFDVSQWGVTEEMAKKKVKRVDVLFYLSKAMCKLQRTQAQGQVT